MHADDRDPLTPAEQATLERWRREPPPPHLETRIVEALRADGGVAAAARRSYAALAAAAILVFALGVATGLAVPAEYRTASSGNQAAAGHPMPRFLLLLTAAPAASAAVESQRVREYGAWAAELAAQGQLVSGERLGNRGETLLPPGAPPDPPSPADALADELQGYFIILARNLQEAIVVARTCPHLKHGGRIRVRPIDRGQ